MHQLLCSMLKERRKNGLSELCKNGVGHSESKSLGMGALLGFAPRRSGTGVNSSLRDEWISTVSKTDRDLQA